MSISEEKSPDKGKTFKKVIRPQQDEESVELKSEEPRVRYLKAQPLYRRNGNGHRIVPDIHLCGNWLAEAGFRHEQYVSIMVADGLLVIRPAILNEITG